VKPETLAQRVKRLMTERRLNAAEVAKRSGNAITDSYVDHLAVGRYTNLSVEKLRRWPRDSATILSICLELLPAPVPRKS